jgi:hypothetical protein
MSTTSRLALLAAILPALWGGVASAASTTLTLTRTALTNVSDTAGLTQYEAGTVAKSGGAQIGYYNVTRRVTTGFSDSLNTAAATITLVLAPSSGASLENITLQGSHSFSSGAFLGSVSAASKAYHFTIDGFASGSSSSGQLQLQWKGATPFP